MGETPGDGTHLLTVVIASVCDDDRSKLLERACASVRAMAGGLDYSIIVVANGARVSPKVLDGLASHPEIRVVRLKSGSYPLARRVGAELASSEFLAFLDDDDELLPNTLEPKIAHFRAHPDVDVLVTDGWRVNDSSRTRIFPPPEARCADLVETLMHAAWGAGALTLRLRNVDLATFDSEFRHMEWTLTVVDLARHHRVAYLDEPTYLYHETTPDSLSKLAEHSLAAPEVWRRLSQRYSDTRYDVAVRHRYGRMCHDGAWECARRGRLREAWQFHRESLRAPGGATFLLFSVKLLYATVRRLFSAG